MNDMSNPMTKTDHIIAVDQLSKTYTDGLKQVEVIKQLDLQVAQSELLAIVGQSGSGKSTLLHLIGGLDEPTDGNVLVQGMDIHQMSAKEQGRFRNQHLGFVYQFHHLLPEFTALENVAMPLLMVNKTVAEAKEKAMALIEAVGLQDRATHKPGELSGGEKQRIALARALVCDPACVLADEPTGNLDAKTAHKTFELMLSLNQSLGTCFVIVTHDQQLASQMNRTLVLESGKLS